MGRLLGFENTILFNMNGKCSGLNPKRPFHWHDYIDISGTGNLCWSPTYPPTQDLHISTWTVCEDLLTTEQNLKGHSGLQLQERKWHSINFTLLVVLWIQPNNCKHKINKIQECKLHLNSCCAVIWETNFRQSEKRTEDSWRELLYLVYCSVHTALT